MRSGSTRSPSRAAESSATWYTAAGTWSSDRADGRENCPWSNTAPESTSINGFSAAALISISRTRPSCAAASSAAPWTCGTPGDRTGPGCAGRGRARPRARGSAAFRCRAHRTGVRRRACTSSANASAEPPSAAVRERRDDVRGVQQAAELVARQYGPGQGHRARRGTPARHRTDPPAGRNPLPGRRRIRWSAISASAVRSPVPIVPVMCTAGGAPPQRLPQRLGNRGCRCPRRRAGSAGSASPPGSSGCRAGPPPPPRTQQQPEVLGAASPAPTTTSRFAPTPVVRP